MSLSRQISKVTCTWDAGACSLGARQQAWPGPRKIAGKNDDNGLPGKAVQDASRRCSLEEAHWRAEDGVRHPFVQFSASLNVTLVTASSRMPCWLIHADAYLDGAKDPQDKGLNYDQGSRSHTERKVDADVFAYLRVPAVLLVDL